MSQDRHRCLALFSSAAIEASTPAERIHRGQNVCRTIRSCQERRVTAN